MWLYWLYECRSQSCASPVRRNRGRASLKNDRLVTRYKVCFLSVHFKKRKSRYARLHLPLAHDCNTVDCYRTPSTFAQQSSSPRNWYAPLTNGDGLRYPLEIGPLTWHLVGSGIYPVKGSDGLIHLAYALQVTNS